MQKYQAWTVIGTKLIKMIIERDTRRNEDWKRMGENEKEGAGRACQEWEKRSNVKEKEQPVRHDIKPCI